MRQVNCLLSKITHVKKKSQFDGKKIVMDITVRKFFFSGNIVYLISSFLEIDFEINISDKRSRRFDLSEVIFKCIKVL